MSCTSCLVDSSPSRACFVKDIHELWCLQRPHGWFFNTARVLVHTNAVKGAGLPAGNIASLGGYTAMACKLSLAVASRRQDCPCLSLRVLATIRVPRVCKTCHTRDYPAAPESSVLCTAVVVVLPDFLKGGCMNSEPTDEAPSRCNL